LIYIWRHKEIDAYRDIVAVGAASHPGIFIKMFREGVRLSLENVKKGAAQAASLSKDAMKNNLFIH